MFELRFFEIYRSEEYILLLLEGIGVSTALTIGAGAMGFLLAFILAALNYWKVPILGLLAACYIDFIRNTPLIVQLFFFAFGLPGLVGYVWPFWCHALLALTINFSGYLGSFLKPNLKKKLIILVSTLQKIILNLQKPYKYCLLVFPN